MKVSVIVPTYKPKEYIWECLQSVSQQSLDRSSYEVIIVLNGCDEPWKGQIARYININMSNHRVKFIHTHYIGVSHARNIALDVAEGEYITFVDDDDYISPQYLEELYCKASQDVISCCYPYAFYDNNPNEQLPYRITNEYIKQSINCKLPFYSAKKYFSGPCMKLIHRDIILKRRFDIKFKNGEDSLFMFLISDKIRYVDFTSKNAIYYRRFRENSAVTTKRSRLSIIKNSLNLIKAYSQIYFRSPCRYNLYFYVTRILGAIKIMLY